MPRLTDLASHPARLPRLLHGLAHRHPAQLARRATQLLWEVGVSAVLDRLRPLPGPILECREGAAGWAHSGVGLYVHWSPSGAISPMVVRQVAAWRECGLDMVFITGAEPSEAALAPILTQSALVIRRANVGHDFAGWRDAMALLAERGHQPDEVLLANDSVLGPFQPLPPLVAMMRAGGAGLFGMTESVAGGVHLQSYALLARGAAAVAVLRQHLMAIPNWRSKWRLVQAGEIGLTRRMRLAGLRCAALFGYGPLCALARPDDLAALGARFLVPEALATYPLNPTHHLWRLLLDHGFPFIKTELVRRNPGRLPGVEEWGAALSPEDRALAEEHLGVMGQ